jgi:hypothetical protein
MPSLVLSSKAVLSNKDNYNNCMGLDMPSRVVVLSLLLVGILMVVGVLVPFAAAAVAVVGNDSTAAVDAADGGDGVVDDITSCNHLVLHSWR